MDIVFVYGSLRKGFHNHRLLESSKYIGTYRENIGMDMVDLGSFPGLVPYNGEYPFHVTVEAYEVTDEVLQALDYLEGYPSFYNRKKITISNLTGYIYYLTDNFYRDKEIVKSGDWLEYKYLTLKEV